MNREIKAKVSKETKEGTYFNVLVPKESLTEKVKKYSNNGIIKGELRIDDGRNITSEQRKKIYATLKDISMYLGYPPEMLKELMKFEYMIKIGEDYFSLSNCSVSTAREFINFIIDFILEWGIPLEEELLNRTDDIDTSIYACIKYRKCTLCGNDGEVHHWDSIGMGNDRKKIDDSNLRKLCLCRKHHTEAHKIGKETFESKYHVYGIIYKE